MLAFAFRGGCGLCCGESLGRSPSSAHPPHKPLTGSEPAGHAAPAWTQLFHLIDAGGSGPPRGGLAVIHSFPDVLRGSAQRPWPWLRCESHESKERFLHRCSSWHSGKPAAATAGLLRGGRAPAPGGVFVEEFAVGLPCMGGGQHGATTAGSHPCPAWSFGEGCECV